MDAGSLKSAKDALELLEAQSRATPASWRACLNKYFVHRGLIGLIKGKHARYVILYFPIDRMSRFTVSEWNPTEIKAALVNEFL